MIFEKEVQL